MWCWTRKWSYALAAGAKPRVMNDWTDDYYESVQTLKTEFHQALHLQWVRNMYWLYDNCGTMTGQPRTKLEVKFDSKLYRAAPHKLQRSALFNFFALAVKTVSLVLFYYCFSISLTFYNKWLIKVSVPPAFKPAPGGLSEKSTEVMTSQKLLLNFSVLNTCTIYL